MQPQRQGRPLKLLPEIQRIIDLMEQENYIADRDVATAVHLAMALGKPLLLEGEAGVGKTEVAKVLARALETNLIRLQCYEGLDAAAALYEWNYPRQMLHLKLDEGSQRSLADREREIFSDTFLLKRPLLQAITQEDRAPVLLIDEVDRADEEFEAFCLEVLSDFQVTIPELGTITARHKPAVVLTSNRTRELSDALRRRCLYLWLDYPDYDRELRIVRKKVPQADHALAQQICQAMQVLRRVRLAKVPGVAETLDWAAALVAMHADHLDRETLEATLGAIFKDPEDFHRARQHWVEMLGRELEQSRGGAAVWDTLARRLEERAATGGPGTFGRAGS